MLFGGTGDLVTRKLLPALYRRYVAGQVSAESRIYGIARTALSRGEYLAQAEAACQGFLGQEFDAAGLGDLQRACSILSHRRRRRGGLCAARGGAGGPRSIRARVLSSPPPRICSPSCARIWRRTGWSRRCPAWCSRSRSGHDPASAEFHQRPRRRGVHRTADLSHRPLPRQGGRAESHGAALRQRAVRAAVAARTRQPRADHRGRGARRRAPRPVLRQDRRAARHGAEPSAAAALHHGDGAAGAAATRTRCATRS